MGEKKKKKRKEKALCPSEFLKKIVGGEAAEVQERWRCVTGHGDFWSNLGDPGAARHGESCCREGRNCTPERRIISDSNESVSHG